MRSCHDRRRTIGCGRRLASSGTLRRRGCRGTCPGLGEPAWARTCTVSHAIGGCAPAFRRWPGSLAGVRGCSSMVEHQLPKLTVRVRFSSPAPRMAQSLLFGPPQIAAPRSWRESIPRTLASISRVMDRCESGCLRSSAPSGVTWPPAIRLAPRCRARGEPVEHPASRDSPRCRAASRSASRPDLLPLVALKAIQQSSRERQRKAPTGAYLCPLCRGQWHLPPSHRRSPLPWRRRHQPEATGP